MLAGYPVCHMTCQQKNPFTNAGWPIIRTESKLVIILLHGNILKETGAKKAFNDFSGVCVTPVKNVTVKYVTVKYVLQSH